MLVENQKIEKLCSFYVSDFHLEMILVPYINRKIEEKEDINIITERDLRETIEIVISKMNLTENRKNEILNLNWETKKEQITEYSNQIIIGREEYIEQKNIEIEKMKISNISIVNCYDFEEIKEEIGNIISKHDRSLNTLGFNKF